MKTMVYDKWNTIRTE